MLGKLLAVLKANPAIVSWLLTMGTGLLAHYGFKVSSGTLLVIMSEVVTIMHAYLHVATKAPKPALKSPAGA